LETLQKIAIEGSQVKEAFREELLKIARTTISSKLLTYEKEHFAQLAVDAVL
jgi:T-complex protein 1 subunit beta